MGARRADPDAASYLGRGEAVVPSDHVDADPGAVRLGDRVEDLEPGRVEHRDQPEQTQPILGIGAGEADHGVAIKSTAGDRQYSQSLRGVVVDQPGQAGSVEVGEVAVPPAALGDSGAPRQHCFGCALGVHGNVSVAFGIDGGHAEQVGVEVEHRPSTGVASVRIEGHTHGAGQLEQREFGRIPGRRPRGLGGQFVAGAHGRRVGQSAHLR